MDAQDIFRKLTRGARFNVKKSSSVKINIVNNPDVINTSETLKIKPGAVVTENENILNIDDSFCNDGGDTGVGNVLTILGSITTADNDKKSKKKSKKKNKEMTKDKIAMLEQEKINQYRNENNITVVGRHVSAPIKTFDEIQTQFNVKPELIDNFKKCGYDEPTPIQKQAIPIMLQGRQILACAPTGSGKTAAFLLPLLHALQGPQKQGFRAVVLCPTRELAKQTLRECLRLGEGSGLRAHIISKVNQAAERYGPKSSKKYDILITTPNRLCFLLNQDPPAISLNNVQWLVIDEADKLFETGVRGFREQLAQITTACSNENKRIATFSATHTPAVVQWACRNLRGLICVTIGHRNTAAELVDQKLLFVGNESGKLIAIRDLIRKGLKPPVLVFVQSKQRAQELFTELIYDGINVDVIHADRTQTQRDNTVRAFREGRIWVLICTELMGRGVDFLGVNLVLNYDFPTSAISYIHRIGRTGRAGHRGKAITFFTQSDVVNLRSIAQVLRSSGCEVPEYMLTLKKTNKREKKKLQTSAQDRESISTIPGYDQQKRNKIKKQKEKEQAGGKNLENLKHKSKKFKKDVRLETRPSVNLKRKKSYVSNMDGIDPSNNNEENVLKLKKSKKTKTE